MNCEVPVYLGFKPVSTPKSNCPLIISLIPLCVACHWKIVYFYKSCWTSTELRYLMPLVSKQTENEQLLEK
jgi:hypothetical protein